MYRALIATTKSFAPAKIARVLGDGYAVDCVGDASACLKHFQTVRYDVSFIDIEVICTPSGKDGPADVAKRLQPFWDAFPNADIVILTGSETVRDAVRAVKAGASDILTCPFTSEEVRYVLSTLRETVLLQSELGYLRDEFWKSDAIEQVRTSSPLMRQVMKKVRLAAPTRTTVLLNGETGTGKGVLAKLIHGHSSRSEQQFVSVHCGAIPDTLLESELFGHEKGAFTGATRRALGKFEIAHGGTIFLDEIGTLSPSAQIKLLHVLQDRTIQRVGGEKTVEVDVRIIAATNVDLKELAAQGSFRTDLYYRLNVFPIDIPPLRDRPEDLPHLVESLIRKSNRLLMKEIRGLHPDVLAAFQAYPWPGNVRELENLIERGFILEESPILTPESLPGELFDNASTVASSSLVDTSETLEWVRRVGIEDVERRYLDAQLGMQRGRIDRTAAAAGISTRQLHKLMAKYGLRKENFKSPASVPAASAPEQ